MANMFTLILVVATFITGLLWFIDKFIFKHHEDETITQINTRKKIDKNVLRIKSKPNRLKTGASIFPVLAIVLIIRSFIYEPFRIPSGSMMPTLLIGDFIIVEKFSYGIKDPICHKTLIKTGHPKRGDVIVFKYPKDPHLNYIKRAIGLPGDKITYDPVTKEVTVQPGHSSAADTDPCKDTLLITYSSIENSDFIQIFPYLSEERKNSSFFEESKSKSSRNSIRLIKRKETIENIMHYILTIPIVQDQLEMYYHQPGQQLATWIVPSGQYFVMGDNRDNSADSRYWGFVPESNLVGKAIAIWASFEKQEGKWLTNIRLNRIGKIR